MTLREFCKENEQYEIEVWDENVDIDCPYYFYEKNTYEDDETDHYLHVLENWFLDLEVTHSNLSPFEISCCVDVYSFVEKHWDVLKQFYDNNYEPECDCTQDVFTTLSQGYYSFAKKFVTVLGLEEKYGQSETDC
jgi:hypothetical protein